LRDLLVNAGEDEGVRGPVYLTTRFWDHSMKLEYAQDTCTPHMMGCDGVYARHPPHFGLASLGNWQKCVPSVLGYAQFLGHWYVLLASFVLKAGEW
jgi:hypothetical protein